MEAGKNCAYNKTRDCFLGLHVVAGDFAFTGLRDWLNTLTAHSGAGVWMVPFRGALATDLSAPLDLLYLDEDCRVVDTVEFYPTCHVSPNSPPAYSVLALPSHSIFASQTQRGDRLMIYSAEEMEHHLEHLSETSIEPVQPAPASTPKGPVLVRMEPKKAAMPAAAPEVIVNAAVLAPPMASPPPVQQAPQASPSVQDKPPEAPSGKPMMPRRGWLERWLRPEPSDPRRKSSRQPVAGLSASFWTGGAPQVHEIRDISPTGLYVVTTERWYPGTAVRMTLSKPDTGQHPSQRSITVNAVCVRWGNDGVGLEFVLADPRKGKQVQGPAVDPINSQQLQQFLTSLQ